MNTDEIINEHSLEKLTLYNNYLSIYLNILLRTPKFNSVRVFDPFAGMGRDSNGVKGSAVRAAEIIDAFRHNPTFAKKKISLILNEIDHKRFENLKREVDKFVFVEVTNLDANVVLQDWTPSQFNHDFLFIDPFGYSSLQHETLIKLISAQNSEVLMFLPLNSFERLKGNLAISQANTMKGYYKNIGITEDQITSDLDAKSLLKIIVNGFKATSKSKFVQSHIFENRSNGNRYALIFITHHLKGADKFLEAKSKMLKGMKEQDSMQSGLGFMESSDIELFLDLGVSERTLQNNDMFYLGIEHGYHSTQIKEAISRLLNEGKLEIERVDGKKRISSHFYLTYDSRNEHILRYKFGKIA